VAHAVVHRLEVVQVDVEQGDGPGVGALALILQALRQAGAVEQPGQRVALGQVGQALLLAPLGGDVLADADEAVEGTIDLERDAAERQEGAAVLGGVLQHEVDGFTGKGPLHVGHAASHLLGPQHLDGRPPQDVTGRAPHQPLEGAVHETVAPGGIDDHHRGRQGFGDGAQDVVLALHVLAGRCIRRGGRARDSGGRTGGCSGAAHAAAAARRRPEACPP
jgi:hypothetical protein